MLSQSICTIITAILGCALIGSGLYGIISPTTMARQFGVVDITKDMTVFYPGIGGRNLTAGLFVWTMKLTNQPKPLGAFLICLICTGITDTYLLSNHWAPVDPVWGHVFITCVAGVVGHSLLMA